jgi:hypothetical protein
MGRSHYKERYDKRQCSCYDAYGLKVICASGLELCGDLISQDICHNGIQVC